jgi:transposase-like protein
VPGGGVSLGQQRRQFSPEFKADAVALVRSSGWPIAAIAQELGIRRVLIWLAY